MGDSWSWAGYLYEEDEMGCTDDPGIDGMAALQAMKDKVAEKGYPGLGPVTSQQDTIKADAEAPGMYESTFSVSPSRVIEITDRPAVWVERLSPDSARLEFENIPNEQAMRIVTDILPKVMELYMQKSRDYG